MKSLVFIGLISISSFINVVYGAEPVTESEAAEAKKNANEMAAAQSLAHKNTKLMTYSAKFEQKVQNANGKVLDLTSGEFYIEKPNHFRWHIMQQYEQLIVADGAHIYTHDPELEQVTIQTQSKLLADSPLLFLTSTADQLNINFVISELEMPKRSPTDNRQLYQLKPRGQGGVFEQVHILFENETMIELLMIDTLGQKTTVTFSAVKLNSKLEPSLFSFIMPEGVDIVDSRERQINKAGK